MATTKWYTSKVLWTNTIAIIAIIIQGVSGKEIISIELQATILAGVNMLLRLVTKQPIGW